MRYQYLVGNCSVLRQCFFGIEYSFGIFGCDIGIDYFFEPVLYQLLLYFSKVSSVTRRGLICNPIEGNDSFESGFVDRYQLVEFLYGSIGTDGHGVVNGLFTDAYIAGALQHAGSHAGQVADIDLDEVFACATRIPAQGFDRRCLAIVL